MGAQIETPPSYHRRSFTVYCDGAARGNPGPAGIGVVVLDGLGRTVREVTRFLGHTTNNQAEYAGLITALELAEELAAEEVHIKMDSELVVKQIKRQYRVRSLDLKPFFDEAMERLKKFKRFTIAHVPREQNREADRLANVAIDSHA